MDRFHLSPLNTSHTYEYIDVEIPAAATKRRNSESDLLRLVGHELEIINQLIKGTKVPTEEKSDVTFSLYEQVEQGFYKCHDSIYDVPEGLRIPDLKKKPKLVSKKNTISKRRLSLDSGRGTSVDGDTDVSLLDSSFASSSQPSLKAVKANDLLEELNMSDALDRICGTSSLESLPGYRKCPPPPPLPPRGQKGALPPVPPPSSSKKSLLEVPKGQENPPGKQQQHEYKRKLFKNPLKHKRLGLLTPTKLTPVKLLCSPFLQRGSENRRRRSAASSKKGVASQVEKGRQNSPSPALSPFSARENLESLAEAQIYGLPIIPFPYSAERRRLIATEGRRIHREENGPKLKSQGRIEYGNVGIARKLNFDETTPLGVRALATPAGKRRLVYVPSEDQAEDSSRHCSTCTCNQAVSRREMLTRHRLDFLPSLSSLNNNGSGSLQQFEEEMKRKKQNHHRLHQEVDYVKMNVEAPAKLV